MIPADMMPELLAAKALMTDAETLALAEFASLVPAEQEIVEIGSWAGGSAAWLCAGSKYGVGAHITCVDIWEDWIDPPQGQWPAKGKDAFSQFTRLVDSTRLTALRAESHLVSQIWTKPIGLLFIDGLHTYDACKSDMADWSGFVVPGGVMAVHDYLEDQPSKEFWWTEGPTRAVQEIASEWDSVEIIGHALWTGRKP